MPQKKNKFNETVGRGVAESVTSKRRLLAPKQPPGQRCRGQMPLPQPPTQGASSEGGLMKAPSPAVHLLASGSWRGGLCAGRDAEGHGVPPYPMPFRVPARERTSPHLSTPGSSVPRVYYGAHISGLSDMRISNSFTHHWVISVDMRHHLFLLQPLK